jgi:death-on-curing protein
MITKIPADMVKLMHRLIAEETGGSVGVKDEGLLDSALENAFQTFDGKELYPSKEEKGARLGYSLISNHAFVDGNKRIGMHIMLLFLEMNGVHLFVEDGDIVEAGLGVASGKMNYIDLLEWVKRHKTL